MAASRAEGSLIGPLLGTIVFVVLMPGTVIGLIPYLLSHWHLGVLGFEELRWVGVVLLLVGAPVFVDFLVRFVRDGRGTPVPVAPTKYLVVSGTYRYVRNPGYLAVLAMIAGQGFLFGSARVLIYAGVVAAAFHLFVVNYEEPTLRRQFGEQYAAYCRQVPRWWPRRTPAKL